MTRQDCADVARIGVIVIAAAVVTAGSRALYTSVSLMVSDWRGRVAVSAPPVYGEAAARASAGKDRSDYVVWMTVRPSLIQSNSVMTWDPEQSPQVASAPDSTLATEPAPEWPVAPKPKPKPRPSVVRRLLTWLRG